MDPPLYSPRQVSVFPSLSSSSLRQRSVEEHLLEHSHSLPNAPELSAAKSNAAATTAGRGRQSLTQMVPVIDSF